MGVENVRQHQRVIALEGNETFEGNDCVIGTVHDAMSQPGVTGVAELGSMACQRRVLGRAVGELGSRTVMNTSKYYKFRGETNRNQRWG